MKSFKHFTVEAAEPKSPDEKRFKDKHVISVTDYPLGDKETNNGTKNSPAKKKRRVDNDLEDAEAVYEGHDEDDDDEMDPVNKKALKKKFKNRKDKDIDNDGDVDDSDEYLHKRRKAVSKAIDEEKECSHCDMKDGKHEKDCPMMKEGYESVVMNILKKKRIDGRFSDGNLYVDKSDVSAAKAALKGNYNIKELPKIIGEDVEGLEEAGFAKPMTDIEVANSIRQYAKKSGGIDKASFMKAADMLAKGKKSQAIAFAKRLDTDPRDWLLDKLGEEVEQVDERNKQNAMKRKSMDAIRGARFKAQNPNMVPGRDQKHKTGQQHNKAIGRALRNEEDLDEISKGLAGRYIKRANVSTADAADANARGNKQIGKVLKRFKGVSRATDKLTGKAKVPARESVDEAFKVGQNKLKDGSVVKLASEDVKVLKDLYKNLNSSNRKTMDERATRDEKSFKEVLAFAKETMQ